MKNEAIAPNGSAELAAAWSGALELLDQDLRRRGAADGRARAYATDVEELGRWAARYASRPRDRLPVAAPLRRPDGGARPGAAHGRPQAGRLRACFRVLVEHGRWRPTRPSCSRRPKLRSACRGRSSPADVAALLDRIPASTPLEQRDRAMFELAYACGLRAEELVDLDVGSVDFDAEQVRVEGKGGKTRFVPVGEHALAPCAYLERARGALAAGTGEPALFLSKTGRRLSTSDVRRRLRTWARACRRAGRRPSARPAPLVRDPSARGRRRSAGHPGAARPRVHIDNPGLHSGRISASAGCVRASHPRA